MPTLVAEGSRITDAFAAAHALHRTDAEALIRLMAADAEGGKLTTGALGAELSLTSGATTFAVNRLESAGLVRRERDTADQRRILLALSDGGRALASRFFAPVQASNEALLARFTVEELASVRRFLTETADAMRECRTLFENLGEKPG